MKQIIVLLCFGIFSIAQVQAHEKSTAHTYQKPGAAIWLERPETEGLVPGQEYRLRYELTRNDVDADTRVQVNSKKLRITSTADFILPASGDAKAEFFVTVIADANGMVQLNFLFEQSGQLRALSHRFPVGRALPQLKAQQKAKAAAGGIKSRPAKETIKSK